MHTLEVATRLPIPSLVYYPIHHFPIDCMTIMHYVEYRAGDDDVERHEWCIILAI